jgi:hypothetical protein
MTSINNDFNNVLVSTVGDKLENDNDAKSETPWQTKPPRFETHEHHQPSISQLLGLGIIAEIGNFIAAVQHLINQAEIFRFVRRHEVVAVECGFNCLV